MKRKRLAFFAATAFLLAALLSPGIAATPPSGTIAPDDKTRTWAGPEATSVYETTSTCGDPGVVCDDYALTVDVPESYWDDQSGGAKVEIKWAKASDVFDFKIFDREGKVVAENTYSVPGDVGRTSIEAVIEKASREAGPYRVHVRYIQTTQASYSGTATLVVNEGGAGEKGEGAFFDTSAPLAFAPSTTVSAHFLGAEPQMTMERQVPGGKAGVTDPNRIFVDYPLSFRAQIGQLNRSEDGGDSFRLLFDPTCASRSRPTCQTGGGGDSDNDVNMFTGTLFFADQEGTVAQESMSSSINHGDSFPSTRQWAITNTTSASDREWVAAADDGTIKVGTRRVEAFLAYARVASGIFVQGIDQDGLPIPQPVAQIGTTIGVPGRVEVDTSGGPGNGWIYVAYPALQPPGTNLPRGIHVATAPGNSYQDRNAWISNKVTDDLPDVFVWLAIDTRGNAYASWVENGIVYYSYSLIDAPANDPRQNGRPGTSWSKQYRVSAPEVGSAIFPAITAGAPGRIAISYLGSEDFEGNSSQASPEAGWHAYAAVVEDATEQNGLPIVHTGRVSHRVIHTGPINGSDTSLLDFIDVDHDQTGRVGVVFMDNNSTFGETGDGSGEKTKPFTQFAKQVSGPSLLSADADVKGDLPSGSRPDASGDATWPNAVTGRLLPSLDLLGASLQLEGYQLVARLPLMALSEADVKRDLTSFNPIAGPTSADRVKYVVRFNTDGEVFHMSGEITADGTKRFYGGRLDQNDQVSHGGTVVMASYRSDQFYPVTATVESNTLVLRASAAAFGVDDGTELYGANAFSMAGPDQMAETLFDPMRTVDATPPFDVTLMRAVKESPTPTPSPTASQSSPSPSPSPTGEDPPSQGRCDIVGTPGNDYLPGTDEGETICGLGGNDVLIGGSGDDTLLGGEGDDRLFGQAGEDVLNGRRGSDELRGGTGGDTLLGRPGHDILFGGSADDFLRGGRGRDRCRGGAGRNHLRGCEDS